MSFVVATSNNWPLRCTSQRFVSNGPHLNTPKKVSKQCNKPRVRTQSRHNSDTVVVLSNTIASQINRTTSASSPLSSDTTSKLDVLWHDGHPLRVNSAQIRILKQTNQIRLRRLLQGQHRGALESEICLEVLRNLTHQPLEGQLTNQ